MLVVVVVFGCMFFSRKTDDESEQDARARPFVANIMEKEIGKKEGERERERKYRKGERNDDESEREIC